MKKKTPRLNCHLLDRDPAWGESWSDVGKKVKNQLELTTHFNPFDVTDPDKWTVFKKHFQADLFTLIYFVSEVYALREKANAYFEALFKNMKPGAMLMFVDNSSQQFVGWFDDYASRFKLDVLESGAGIMKMPWAEEKSDLDPYRTKLKRNPKLDANVGYRIVRKK